MAPHGTSKAYILERLKREGRTDFINAIEAGQISAHAVACELGWVHRPATLRSITNQAKRRQHQFNAVAGDGRDSDRLMELWLGPNPSYGSVFSSREELEQAWQMHRTEVMRLWGQHSRRPMAWWCFDAPDLGLKWPGYDREQSYLFEAGVLSEVECAELVRFWRREFDRDHKPAHLNWADVPHSLRRQWQAERRGRQSAPLEEAAAK